MKQVLDSLSGMQTKIEELQTSISATSSALTAGQHRAEELASRVTAIESNPPTAQKRMDTPESSGMMAPGADLLLGSPLPPPLGDAAARPSASTQHSGSTDHCDPRLYRGDAPIRHCQSMRKNAEPF